MKTIYHYHSVQSDTLLHDIVLNIIYPKFTEGRSDITVGELTQHLDEWNREGKMTTMWSDYTKSRVAQGLLSALRDFGLLQGNVTKTIAPPFIPLDAFVYIAFIIHQDIGSGDMLIQNSEWKLFLLNTEDVERLFIKAHQEGLLEYYAAGDVIRIEFPEDNILEYVKHVVKGAY